MSNYWYFDLVSENGSSQEFETNDIFSIQELMIDGNKVFNIEDDYGFAKHVVPEGIVCDEELLQILKDFDTADELCKAQMYAKYVLGVNHCKLEDINIFIGDINTYAQQCVADRFNIDIDDTFILYYVNIERYAHDIMTNDRIEEFRFDGQYYLYIPS